MVPFCLVSSISLFYISSNFYMFWSEKCLSLGLKLICFNFLHSVSQFHVIKTRTDTCRKKVSNSYYKFIINKSIQSSLKIALALAKFLFFFHKQVRSLEQMNGNLLLELVRTFFYNLNYLLL